MNKRIKELAVQAYSLCGKHTNGYNAPAFSEKFAELIVKECISITDDLVNRNVDGSWTSNELYTDYNGALFEVKRRIEEHFGVEV
jgi:uncharacterized protein (DUF2147 family)